MFVIKHFRKLALLILLIVSATYMWIDYSTTVFLNSNFTESFSTKNSFYRQFLSFNDELLNVEREVEIEDADIDFSKVDIPKGMEDSAIKLIGYFVHRGIPLKYVATMVGFWTGESGLDPTTLESDNVIKAPRYSWTKEKEEAVKDIDKYTREVVFPSYAKSKDWAGKIRVDWYKHKGKYYCGIGIGGYTAWAAYELLERAKKVNSNWYDLALQAGFEVDVYAGKGFFNNPEVKNAENRSFDDSYLHFLGRHQYRDGRWHDHSRVDYRKKNIAYFYNKFKSGEWQADEEFNKKADDYANKLK